MLTSSMFLVQIIALVAVMWIYGCAGARIERRVYSDYVSHRKSEPYRHEELLFHNNCARNITIVDGGRTAYRIASSYIDPGFVGVFTNRPLKDNELFQVKYQRRSNVREWAYAAGIGLTTLSPENFQYTKWMDSMGPRTWLIYGHFVIEDSQIAKENYPRAILEVGDTLGIMRSDNGALHLFVNGVDQGAAADKIPKPVYGILDMHGNGVEFSII